MSSSLELILSVIRHHGGLAAEQRNAVADLTLHTHFLSSFVANGLGVCGGGGAGGSNSWRRDSLDSYAEL